MPSAPVWQLVAPAVVDRLVSSPDPAARWVALTGLQHRPLDDPLVVATHTDVLADPLTHDLLGRIVPWDVENPVSGHQHPLFAPNLLALLADRGVGAADDERVAQVHGGMLAHQDPDGRFLALGRTAASPEPAWGALACDFHAVLETLLRAGRGADPRVRRGVERLTADRTDTHAGRVWGCRPDPRVGFRGPGRVGDACPQVTVEALRVYSWVPEAQRPAGVVGDAVTALLRIWRDRASHQPYMFGHGRRFKEGKWPPTWYSALAVLDVLGRFPETWSAADTDPADRQAVAEIAACVAAYGMGPTSEVVPRSVYAGFAAHSFGQKKHPSDLATALVATVLTRVDALADQVAQVDLAQIGSSKGGSGSPLPPR